MKLLVVLLNYNGLQLTRECLESLEPEVVSLRENHQIDATVGLCDNGSSPPEPSALSELINSRGWDSWIDFRQATPNLGFTGGNNYVVIPSLESAQPPDYVFLLNNDTVLRPHAIKHLVDFMESRPDVGIAGGRLEDPDGTPQCSAFNFLNAASELDRGLQLGVVSRLLAPFLCRRPIPDKPSPTDWVAAASMIIRREVLEEIGGLDEKYFTHFEDMDFCRTALAAGWPTWYVPASRIVHFVGKTTGLTDVTRQRERRPQYYFDARRRYLTKQLHPLHAVACDLGFITGHSLNIVRTWIFRRKREWPAHTLWDHTRNCVLLRGFRPPVVKNPAMPK